MVEYPLLKYSVSCEPKGNAVTLSYRRREYEFEVENPVGVIKAFSLADGRTHLNEIARNSKVEFGVCKMLFDELANIPLLLDGRSVLRDDGYLSGRELFWRLERLLMKWRYEAPVSIYRSNLDQMIATGQVPPAVVKGFCLELGYLLRQVPDELSLAVSHASNERVRSLFMEFYDEESRHGEILFDALKTWFPSDDLVLNATPLPATTGLLNTYRAWAMRDPLLYAVALMRDESSRLDKDVPEDEDIYRGMRAHYDVPAVVVDKFEWHANLDRNCDHGFFPEQVFGEYEAISRSRATLLVSALKQIIELHDLFRWNVLAFYSSNPLEDRLGLLKELTSNSHMRFL